MKIINENGFLKYTADPGKVFREINENLNPEDEVYMTTVICTPLNYDEEKFFESYEEIDAPPAVYGVIPEI